MTQASPSQKRTHIRALAIALFVTVLWSSSWVFIKVGLEEIPPLTFAGLRYAAAFFCLAPFALTRAHRSAFARVDRSTWVLLIAFGLVQYAVTQGAQFLSLAYLPAKTASLVLAFTPALVAIVGAMWLGERLVRMQWVGLILFLVGAIVYFGVSAREGGQAFGLIIAVVGLVANAVQGLLGRRVNRSAKLPSVVVTTVTMGIGAAALLTTGVVVQGLPPLTVGNVAIVVWLAVVNTALAFTLWNHTQRTLTAFESSTINNTMLIQIAFLAVFVLGETLSGREVTGIALVALGILAVQAPKFFGQRVG